MKPNQTIQFFRKKISPESIFSGLSNYLLKNKTIFFIICSVLILGFIIQSWPSLYSWDTDSPSFYTAARGISEKINIYDVHQFNKSGKSIFGKSQTIYPYLYPPLLAQFFIPLTWMDYPAYFRFILCLNILLTILSIFLIYALVQNYSTSPTPLLIIFLLFLLQGNIPLHTTIGHGQINLLIFTLILTSLLLLKKDKPYLSSLFLCLAICFKIYPLLFVILFLGQKKIRHFFYLIINFGVLFLFSVLISGMKPWVEFINITFLRIKGEPVSIFFSGFNQHQDNNSLRGFLIHLRSFNNILGIIVTVVVLVSIILGGIILIKICRQKSNISDSNLVISVLFISALLLSPITWSHHYVILLFPVANLFSKIWKYKTYNYFYPLLILSYLAFFYPAYGGFPFNQTRLFGAVMLFLLSTYMYAFTFKALPAATLSKKELS